MRHVIFVDLDIDDEQELEAFAYQASVVQPVGMDSELVLDALGEENAQLLRSGRLAMVHYAEGNHDYVVCVHPPRPLVDAQCADANKRQYDALVHEWVSPESVMALPMDAKAIRHVQRRGGGYIHVGLLRLEARVLVTADMARDLLQYQSVTLPEPGKLLQQPVAGYELFIPRALRPGQVEYRRIH